MSEPCFTIDTEYTRHALTEMWRVLYRRKFIFFKVLGAALFLCSAFAIIGGLFASFSLSFSTLLLLVLICVLGLLSAFCPQYLMLAINRTRLSRHLGPRHIELYEDALCSTGISGKVTRVPWILLRSFAESREYFFLDFGPFFSILSKEGLSEQHQEDLRLFLKEHKESRRRG